MQEKLIAWEGLKKETASITQEGWDKIDLKVKIAGGIIAARQGGDLTQRALEELPGVRQPVIARAEKRRHRPAAWSGAEDTPAAW